jgi:hypothetical protein
MNTQNIGKAYEGKSCSAHLETPERNPDLEKNYVKMLEYFLQVQQ